MTKILVLPGSLRKNAFSKRIAAVAAEGVKRSGGEATFVDLADLPMSLYNADDHERDGFPENAERFQQLIAEHDGFIISSPEYNGSVPGGLKNALDWASRANGGLKIGEAFRGKHAVILTSSPGSFGGLRTLAHLRGILTIMMVNVLPAEIAVSFVDKKFDGDGWEMTDERTRQLLEDVGASLVAAIERR